MKATSPIILKPLIMAWRKAVSFPEIVVAIAVFAILALPIYQTMHNVQTDTSKSIYYFRAMELANEAVEYVRLLPLDKDFKLKAEGLSGSLVVEQAAALEPAKLLTGENGAYQEMLESEVQYSSQYNPACFYRTVEVADLTGSDYSGFLKKVIVTVYWDNAGAAGNLHDPGSRTKKVVLGTLINDWGKMP